MGALGDLTEEEALRYAQMASEEAFQQDEQRRVSDSAADTSVDTGSSLDEKPDTGTPEPSIFDGSSRPHAAGDDESELEQQMQQAIRLSLLGGVNDTGQSPQEQSSAELGFSVRFKVQGGRKGKRSGSGSPSPSASHTPIKGAEDGPSWRAAPRDEDPDLALALSLSMHDQRAASSRASAGPGPEHHDDFSPLDSEAGAKARVPPRW